MCDIPVKRVEVLSDLEINGNICVFMDVTMYNIEIFCVYISNVVFAIWCLLINICPLCDQSVGTDLIACRY